MIVNKYKIKVGIEEFGVQEEDIPRIVQAMQTNDIVKLNAGLFRGQAILALIKNQVMLADPLTPEEEKEKAMLEARRNCVLCGGAGYVIEFHDRPRGGTTGAVLERVAVQHVCKCQKS